jgi:hypothetical protein
VLFGVGSGARSASKSDPSPRIATHCIDELIVCPTRVTVGSRLGVKSQADSQRWRSARVANRYLERNVDLPENLPLRVVGDTDPAGLSESFEPGCDVDAFSNEKLASTAG